MASGNAALRQPYPYPPPEYRPQIFAQLIEVLRLRDLATPNAPASIGWLPSNYTPTRTLDASTATATDVANVLCTLLADLKAAGYLG